MKRPHILYIVPDLFGPPSGIARYCRMVCRALTESGHRVTTISLLDQNKARNEAKATFPDMRYCPCSGDRRQFILRALRALQMRPDLILVGHPNFAPLGWGLGLLARAPIVNFIYGVDAWETLSPMRRRALCAGKRLISISRFTAMRSQQVNAIPQERVRILHNCLDPNFQGHAVSGARDIDAKSLLTVARMSLQEQYKGHDVVIKALPELLKRFPGLIYHIVGDGDGRPLLESLSKEHGVESAVRFHGVVSEEELIERYQNASVFVMPSRFEGFGFVFLEAMTYGKPVVCGNADASVEVVTDGETGFTVDPTSSQAVGDAVARLLEDNELRAHMGEAAIRRVEEKFGFPHFKEQLLSFLSEVRPALVTK
ncbi:GDP-mannose-dependent alpha-(1-6)-phosphatidylinositol monomannoside mannosyltransferase [Abditibacteriota bacterium]|nr:GDP-mannose-dependent alpha-(1-6)-phosphatidylinositol monomannoside mannosyltransferase [Abditibacteriota bacterium]